MSNSVEQFVTHHFGPRCKTKDMDDFPELKETDPVGRCAACEIWEAYDEWMAEGGKEVSGGTVWRWGKNTRALTAVSGLEHYRDTLLASGYSAELVAEIVDGLAGLSDETLDRWYGAKGKKGKKS